MTLRECPNPECRVECELQLYTENHDGEPGLYRVECTSGQCGYSGPHDYSPERSIRLHNNMPREAPWVSVTERMPEDNEQECYVALRNGEVFGTLSWSDSYWQWSQDGCPFTTYPSPVTHWRPHTPPKHPGARPTPSASP